MHQIGFILLGVILLASCFKTKTNDAALTEQKAKFANVSAKQLTVQFSSIVTPGVPVEFRPLVRAMKVNKNEDYEIQYRFNNLSDRPIEIVAAHTIMPEGAAKFFKKMVCFCFEKQTLEPRQTVDMAVKFKLENDLPDNVDAIGLSYTLHEVKKDVSTL